jgi:serine/threonine-protein kinase RsbW
MRRARDPRRAAGWSRKPGSGGAAEVTGQGTEVVSRFAHAGHMPGSPLVPTGVPEMPLAPACCAERRWWLVTLDRERLRQARDRAGLSQRRLARAAGVGRATIGKLEGQDRPRCHFRTRARVAFALGTHPKAITAPDGVSAGTTVATVALPGPAASRADSRSFPARADQVREARAFVRQVLAGCPVIDSLLLVCSELASNAVQHSASARPGGAFTVRAAVLEGVWAQVEIEDEGGRWAPGRRSDEGGRGLLVVDELADWWDIREDGASRTVCARLRWPHGG